MTAASSPICCRSRRHEAASFFGCGEVYLERHLERPRHIEIQILGDGQGGIVHLGERDCSLQRSHQKVLEETPSPALNQEQRDRLGALAVEALRELGYKGVGTLEFLYQDGEFFFIEMNTRLQVEHPVTEMVSGIDIVREQLRIAAGAPLGYRQADIKLCGHAIECRINAENPETFAPSPGRVTDYHAPGGLGVRVDSALYQGYEVPPYYDSLIAKLIVHGKSRNECLMRLRRALEEYVIGGIETTIPLHQRLVDRRRLHRRRLRRPLARAVCRASGLTGAELAAADPRHSGPRLCRRGLPDGRIGRRPRALLGRSAPPRHPPARRVPRAAPAAPRGAPAIFEIRCDSAFEDVIRGCAEASEKRPNTWINDEIVRLYAALFARGAAHSVECWRDGELVGGLYGVSLGAVFFGESMFSRETDASKVALVHLVARLRLGGFRLLDTQFLTPHLARFGGIEISRARYHRLLAEALSYRAVFSSALPDCAGGDPLAALQSSTLTS